MPIITLTTDFGLSSPYIAAMRGVIKTINPRAEIIDITHAVRPQDLRHGAIVLADITPYFPEASIHVAVVDPGVGTDRQIIAAEIDRRYYVLPDNGLLTLLLQRCPANQIVRLDRPEFWLGDISSTFHGRDIMAPAASHLSLGRMRLPDLGTPIPAEDLVLLNIPEPAIAESGDIEGEIIDIDTFGNLITNITTETLQKAGLMSITTRMPDTASPNQPLAAKSESAVKIILKSGTITEIIETYGQSPPGSLIALVGSSGRLEIATVNGSAQKEIAANIGDPVRISLQQ